MERFHQENAENDEQPSERKEEDREQGKTSGEREEKGEEPVEKTPREDHPEKTCERIPPAAHDLANQRADEHGTQKMHSRRPQECAGAEEIKRDGEDKEDNRKDEDLEHRLPEARIFLTVPEVEKQGYEEIGSQGSEKDHREDGDERIRLGDSGDIRLRERSEEQDRQGAERSDHSSQETGQDTEDTSRKSARGVHGKRRFGVIMAKTRAERKERRIIDKKKVLNESDPLLIFHMSREFSSFREFGGFFDDILPEPALAQNLIERLLGDVLLTREEVAEILQKENLGPNPWSQFDRYDS